MRTARHYERNNFSLNISDVNTNSYKYIVADSPSRDDGSIRWKFEQRKKEKLRMQVMNSTRINWQNDPDMSKETLYTNAKTDICQ